jgi:hypothetical protein
VPRKPLPSTFADVYATVSQTLLKELGDSLAVEAGPPTSVEVTPIADPGRAKAWNEPAPEATDEAMLQLAEQRYAEHRASGMDDQKARQATAEDLTHFRYRGRQGIYMNGTVSWAEQVREAERMARVAARHPAPPPPLPPAQLPGVPPMALQAAPPRGPSPAAASLPPGTPPGMPPDIAPMPGGMTGTAPPPLPGPPQGPQPGLPQGMPPMSPGG